MINVLTIIQKISYKSPRFNVKEGMLWAVSPSCFCPEGRVVTDQEKGLLDGLGMWSAYV